MEDYHGNTTAYTYNDLGQLATLTAPGSKVWEYTYDTGNRLTRVDIPNGMHTEYTYDASGRQDSIHHQDSTTVVQGFDYTFDDGGNITRIDHEDGSYWEYAYDGRDRLTDALRGNKATPTIEAVYAYAYDDGDNMLTKVTPWFDDFEDGDITGWSGDTAYFSVSGGVMANTSNASWRGIYLSESDADHDLRFDYVRYSATGTGQIILRFTDPNNLLYLEVNPTVIFLRQRDGGTLTTLDSYSTTVAEDTWYSARAVLDGADVNVWWGEAGGSFDEVLNTASATETATSAAGYFRASPNFEHGFDNIQLIADGRSTTQAFTYNDANEQITSTVNGVTTDMTYDDWGRLVERDDGTHTATYTWGLGSELLQFASDFPGQGTVSYQYGGDGKRRSVDDGASFVWYNWARNIPINEENQGAGVGDGSLSKTYIAFRAEVGGTDPASGTYSYFATDHLGSIRSTFDQAKNNTGNAEFAPFGTLYQHALPSATNARYTAHMFDDKTGLYYAEYRYYAPDNARWLNRDIYGAVDGPNLYAYVSNNPISYWDPNGASQLPTDGGGDEGSDCLEFSLRNDGMPSEKVIEGLKCICKALGEVITVTGGTSPETGSEHGQGGRKPGQHDTGNAADVDVDKDKNPEKNRFFCAAKKCGFTYGLDEGNHFHIDFGGDRGKPSNPGGKTTNQIRTCECGDKK